MAFAVLRKERKREVGLGDCFPIFSLSLVLLYGEGGVPFFPLPSKAHGGSLGLNK